MNMPRFFRLPCLGLAAMMILAPESRAAWIKTGFPGYMSVTCLMEAANGSLLAGTSLNGLQRSVDGGATWTRIKTPAGYSYPVTALAKGAGGEIYLSDGAGVIVSSNEGESWTGLAAPTLISEVRALAYAPGGDLYAGGYNGISRSRDQGKTWKHTGLIEESISSILVMDSDEVYLGCSHTNSRNGGVYRTETVGSDWTFLGASNGDVTGMAIKGTFLFASVSNGGTGGVLGSDRTGSATWYAYSKGLPMGVVSAVAAGPDGALWAASVSGVFRSVDEGQRWSGAGLDSLKVKSFVNHSSGAFYAGTDGGGVYRYSGSTGVEGRGRKAGKKARVRRIDVMGRVGGWRTGVFPVYTGY
jgi:hypothetical protein